MRPVKRPRGHWWWLLLALPLVAGLWRTRFDTEILSLLPGSVPVVRGLQLYQKYFTNSRELMATVRAPDAEAAETAARLLAQALRRETNLVASAVWQPPWLEHPEQMAEFIAFLWLNQPPGQLAALARRLAPERLAAIADDSRNQLATSLSPPDIARLSYDPFGFTQLPAGTSGDAFLASPQEGFASGDGTFRAVFVEAAPELENYRACAAWTAAVRAVEQRVREEPGWPARVTVRYTGAPAFVAEIATSMADDLRFTVLATLALIVGLFWWAHRSWRPLGWLVAMLLLVTSGALAGGGLVFGTLNAVSLGFGAILLGLAVDCGLVVYAEATAPPLRSPAVLRRVLWPGLAWSAVTTAVAFLLLNFAGLPGLSQLGTIVGIGILLAPVVMLFLFLPLVARWLKHQPLPVPSPPESRAPAGNLAGYRIATGLAAGFALIVLWRAGIPVERGNRPLEPVNCAAQAALNEWRAELSHDGEPLLVVISGQDESEVARRLDAVAAHLASASTSAAPFRVRLPSAIWPHPDWQRANQTTAAELVTRAEALRTAAIGAGFTPAAMGLTENLLRRWDQSPRDGGGVWPTNESCRWLLKRATAHSGTNWLAAGAIYPAGDSPLPPAARLDPNLPGVWLTGWTLLGDSLATHVERRVPWLVAVITLVVAGCLRLAFQRWTEVVISLGALAFALLMLQAVMSLTGRAWNLMSLAAAPLLLGAGVDYTIHVQLALRRHHGDVSAMRRVIGRAVLLCAATSVVGFGSTTLSSHPGLASLGLVCAIGIAVACLTAVFLVPAWWLWLNPLAAARPTPAGTDGKAPPPTRGRRRGAVGLVSR